MNSVSNSSYSTNIVFSTYIGTDAKMRATASSGKSTSGKKKKKLNYSFKQISARVQQAKTASDAFLAYVSTLYKVVELKKKCTQEDYDAAEASIALAHAEAILLVARKKKEHLKDEERAEQHAENEKIDETSDAELNMESSEEYEEELSEITEEMNSFTQEEMDKMLRNLEEELRFEEEMSDFCELLDPSLSEDDIEEIKKKHRAREMMEIACADMKYLKAMFEKYEHDRNSQSEIKNTFDTGMNDLTYTAVSADMMTADGMSGMCVDISI